MFVLCHGSADAAILAECDLVSSSVMNFNGDDTLTLECGGFVVDSFGQVGFDPGSSWGSGTTADHTLQRACAVTSGDHDPSDDFEPSLAAEWQPFAADTFDDIGKPTCFTP